MGDRSNYCALERNGNGTEGQDWEAFGREEKEEIIMSGQLQRIDGYLGVVWSSSGGGKQMKNEMSWHPAI